MSERPKLPVGESGTSDTERIGTHYYGCWEYDLRHHLCAVARIAALEQDIRITLGHLRHAYETKDLNLIPRAIITLERNTSGAPK